jgi:hypothetical protein
MANMNATPLLCMSAHSIRAQNNIEENILSVSLHKLSKAASSLVARLIFSHEDGGSKFFQTISKLLSDGMVSHLR